LLLGCDGSKSASHEKASAAESKGGKTENKSAAAEAPMRVTPVRPERKTLVRRTEQPGQIEAFEQTPIYAKATGFVEQGKLDSEGQILAELSIPELEAELIQKRAVVAQVSSEVKQALAAITVARAALVSAEAKLVESRAGVERDEAQYDRWKSELARITELADKKAVTRKLQDETESQLRAADSSRRESAAKVTSAEAIVIESKANVNKAIADHEAAESHLQVAKADEQRVQALLSYATIRAPYDGTIAARKINTGDLVQSGLSTAAQPLFVVVRTDIVRIFVDVPESDAVLTQNNNEALIRIPAIVGQVFKGTVTRSSWILDAATRTLRTEIDIENSDGRLRPGMYAYADVKVAERHDVLSLTRAAILAHEGRSFCYAIDAENKLVKKPIVTGIQAGADVEVVSGLEGDEQVIGTNAASYKEGQQVEIVEKKSPN
jgi:RND family efflux transporter MFP subunit